MRGFAAYVIAVAAVAALIPWPEYWPASLGVIGIAYVLTLDDPDPRPHGGKRSRERES